MSDIPTDREINSVLESMFGNLVGDEPELLLWREKGTGTIIDTAYGKVEVWDDDYE